MWSENTNVINHQSKIEQNETKKENFHNGTFAIYGAKTQIFKTVQICPSGLFADGHLCGLVWGQRLTKPHSQIILSRGKGNL